jgi:hypothetical protein
MNLEAHRELRSSLASSEAHCELRSSLVVVEAALARFVVALAPRRAGIAPTDRATGIGSRFKAAGSWSRAAREVGTSIAHRTAIATWSTLRGAPVATAAAAAATIAATAAAAIATATAGTAAAAIAAATAAAIATTTTAAIGRTRAATTTTTAAAESAATTTATGLTFDGFTDGDRAAVEESTIHGLHCCSALVISFHLEEGEAAAAAGFAIDDHFRRGDVAELGESFLQALGRDRIGQIAHKQFTTH